MCSAASRTAVGSWQSIIPAVMTNSKYAKDEACATCLRGQRSPPERLRGQ